MNEILTTMEYKTSPITTESSLRHSHEGYEFILITQGEVNIKVGGNDMLATAPCVVLLNALEEHVIHDSSTVYNRFFFTLNENFIDEFNTNHCFIELMKFRPDNFRTIIDISGKLDLFLPIFESIHHEWMHKSTYYEDKIANLISNLVIELHRTIYNGKVVNKLPQYIVDIQNYIDKNYENIINIKDICDKFYVNKFYLSRVFKNLTGYSPKEYLTLLRLSKAKKLLLTTNHSINDICFEVGFRDTNNFIKLFKSRYELSPLKFRKVNE